MIDELFAAAARDRVLDNATWATMRPSTTEMKNVIVNQRRRRASFLASQGLPVADDVPVVEPRGERYATPVMVTLAAREGRVAVCTLDGTDPRLSPTRAELSLPASPGPGGSFPDLRVREGTTRL